jgi:hypothetical protein
MDETRDVSLTEMLAAMTHLPDETVFRWYQDSVVIPSRGWHQPTVTMRLTLGQLRRELLPPRAEEPKQ